MIRIGNPADEDQAAPRASRRAALIQNFIIINPPPPKKQEKLVRVTVHFVELSKDYNKIFGFKWAAGLHRRSADQGRRERDGRAGRERNELQRDDLEPASRICRARRRRVTRAC